MITNIFSCLTFEDTEWEYCGRLLDDIYFGKIKCVIGAIQLSELYTLFLRVGDREGLEKLERELVKLKIKIIAVDDKVVILSSKFR